MYLKSLKISSPKEVIRNIEFHKGLNLIVDNTPASEENTSSGNNVGKTTVLRLVDFCLGKNVDSLYKDPENKSGINEELKAHLINNEIVITLILVDNLDSPKRYVTINRNFLKHKKRVYEINGEEIESTKEEGKALCKAIFPTVNVEKPTFRQLISHNIRYEDTRLSNTLKTLGDFGSDEEYEALYLYMFGCNYNQGGERNRILQDRTKEENYKRRLEKVHTKGYYKSALGINDLDISQLEQRKDSLNINPDLEADIQHLNDVKVQLNRLAGTVATCNVRRSIIEDARAEMEARHFREDLNELRVIYDQASSFIPDLQKSFEELVAYHNQMLVNRSKFMTEELPDLIKKIERLEAEISTLRMEELKIQEKITASDTFADLKEIINQLNDCYQRKGNYEAAINAITEAEDVISELDKQLQDIDNDLFSKDFQDKITGQLTKFNVIFADFSSRLYEERYAIKYDIVTKKNGKQIYKFTPMNVEFSTGKKHGEISCFDLAYTKFADAEHIPCLHFLLNDKKELVHGHQLNTIAQIAEEENIQFVASILEDKLTPEMRNPENYVVELSENDKLFRF